METTEVKRIENRSSLDKSEELRKTSERKDTRTPLEKRANSKYITLQLMKKLCSIDSPLRDSYHTTCSCGSVIEQVDGKRKSKYCGYRWCLTCNRIRTAQYIEKYEPILQTWSNMHFVTLTVVNCKGVELSDTVGLMTKNFRRVLDMMRKRHTPIKGIRKLEVTYNGEADTYHPHFHVLVCGQSEAEVLQEEWLRLNPTARASAQKVKSVLMDNVNVYKEIFKYVTKLFDRDETGKYKEINPIAMDVIFCSLKGKRVLQPFGFKAPKLEEEGALELTETMDSPNSEEILWYWEGSDWVDRRTGEFLTNYKPSSETVRMLKETGLDPT